MTWVKSRQTGIQLPIFDGYQCAGTVSYAPPEALVTVAARGRGTRMTAAATLESDVATPGGFTHGHRASRCTAATGEAGECPPTGSCRAGR
jgi:hypothetical protein